MRKTSVLLAAAVLLTLVGCSANHHSIYRHQAVEATSLTVVDAKQRAILAAVPSGASSPEGRRFCAEPSPDVFAVIAQALSVGGSFGRSGDPKAIEAALNAAFSSSEQGSTIPRTQTTNMLREVMYRTCERFLSGGITDVELSLQAVRDQRLIVSILAIEQLTGAVTPKPVVIGASASGSSGSSGADAAIRLDDQFKVAQRKAEAQSAKQAAYDELNGTAKDCDAIAKAVAEKKETDLSQALKDKRPKCEAAAAELAAAKKEKTEADAHYKALSSAASSGGVPVVSSGSLMTPVAGGGLDGGQSESIAQVATAVREIVAGTFKQDEFLFLCLKVLKNGEKLSELSKSCLQYIQSTVDIERKRNEVTAAQIAAAQEEIQEKATALFDQFWRLVSSNDQVDTTKLEAIKKGIKAADWPKCFAGAETKAEYRTCFNGTSVVGQVKRDLARGRSND